MEIVLFVLGFTVVFLCFRLMMAESALSRVQSAIQSLEAQGRGQHTACQILAELVKNQEEMIRELKENVAQMWDLCEIKPLEGTQKK